MGWAIRENGGGIGDFSFNATTALSGSALVVSKTFHLSHVN